MYEPEVEDISDGEEEYYEFTLPEDVSLPQFLDHPRKWNEMVYDTNTLPLWAALMHKVETSSIPQKDKDNIIWYLAEDILHVHGMGPFFDHVL